MRASTAELVATPAHDTLRRVVMWFRVLAFLWMAGLVIATILTDDGADLAWVWAAFCAVTATTVGTIVLSLRRRLDAWWWVVLDGAVAFFAVIAPGLAGASDLFYGGFPLSWLVLVVWARPTIPAGAAAVVALLVAQLIDSSIGIRHLTATDFVGDLAVWIVSGIVYGWALYAIRATDMSRMRESERRIDAENRLVRANLLRRLHDSVLQELAAMKMQPERHDVASAAERLDRMIRRELNRIGADHADGFRVLLYDAVEGACDTFGRWIPAALIEGDCPRSPAVDHLVEAASEALANAFKWSGTDRISVSGRVTDGEVVAEVRDLGRGFDTETTITDIPDRVAPYGGSATVESGANGTAWTIRVPCPPG